MNKERLYGQYIEFKNEPSAKELVQAQMKLIRWLVRLLLKVPAFIYKKEDPISGKPRYTLGLKVGLFIGMPEMIASTHEPVCGDTVYRSRDPENALKVSEIRNDKVLFTTADGYLDAVHKDTIGNTVFYEQENARAVHQVEAGMLIPGEEAPLAVM